VTGSEPAKPVMIVVEDETTARDRIRSELERRYGADYHVTCESSALRALSKLEHWRDERRQVALVLSDQWMPELTGEEFLARARQLHPHSKRALLVEWGAWGDRDTAEAMLRGIARGRMDYYVLKPWRRRDEFFHKTVTDFLNNWERSTRAAPQEIAVVGERWSARAHELRNLLSRNGVPHAFHTIDSREGREMLREGGQEDARGPVVRMLDGTLLLDPSNAEVAQAYGVDTALRGDTSFDVVVLGAGPAGLAAAVYASSEGLRTLVVERESIGGQAGSSALIRNYLGFAKGISGADLAQQAYQQAWVFGTRFLLMREAVSVRRERDELKVAMSDGSEASARAVVVATGVSYRHLGIPGLEELEGRSVFYGASVSEAAAMTGGDVFVVGGGNSAGQTALHLARHARAVTLLVRGQSLALSMSSYLRDQIATADNVSVRTGTQVVGAHGGELLKRLELKDAEGATELVRADALFVMIGGAPRTGNLPPEVARDEKGYLITGSALLADRQGWPLERPPLMLETGMPGVFAVGDVRAGAPMRVASAVGDGSVVIQQVHQLLEDIERDARYVHGV
jgi:thioredoxin reductase (NADPH)